MSKQVGFYTKTKNGNVAHILGDVNMSAETKDALQKMIDLAYNKKINKMSNNKFSNALMLVAEGEYVLLKIEISKGKWVTLIKERLDSPFSHIIEPAGIKHRVSCHDAQRSATLRSLPK